MIRDLRTRSRLALHEAMSFPAIYVAPDLTETAVTIRYHYMSQSFGDMTGFDFDPVQRSEIVPEIICLVPGAKTGDGVDPDRGGVFSVSADEAYEVKLAKPRDGITIKSQVTHLSESEIAARALPVPTTP